MKSMWGPIIYRWVIKKQKQKTLKPCQRVIFHCLPFMFLPFSSSVFFSRPCSDFFSFIACFISQSGTVLVGMSASCHPQEVREQGRCVQGFTPWLPMVWLKEGSHGRDLPRKINCTLVFNTRTFINWAPRRKRRHLNTILFLQFALWSSVNHPNGSAFVNVQHWVNV